MGYGKLLKCIQRVTKKALYEPFYSREKSKIPRPVASEGLRAAARARTQFARAFSLKETPASGWGFFTVAAAHFLSRLTKETIQATAKRASTASTIQTIAG